MKIAVASDHAGFTFKQELAKTLEVGGHEVEDFGCFSQESCDYPDFALPAAKSVSQRKNELAILICGTGVGMCIVANKIQGVRAVLAHNATQVWLSRAHNNTNALCLGARIFGPEVLLDFVKVWLTSGYEGGRHAVRLAKIERIEELCK